MDCFARTHYKTQRLQAERCKAELRWCCIWTRWLEGWITLKKALQVGTDRFVLEENINSINATEKRQKLCVFTQNFTLLSLPVFLSIPAATAAKLGMKLGAGVSGLWHASLWYRLFMLGTSKAKTSKIHHQLSKFKSVCVCVCVILKEWAWLSSYGLRFCRDL